MGCHPLLMTVIAPDCIIEKLCMITRVGSSWVCRANSQGMPQGGGQRSNCAVGLLACIGLAFCTTTRHMIKPERTKQVKDGLSSATRFSRSLPSAGVCVACVGHAACRNLRLVFEPMNPPVLFQQHTPTRSARDIKASKPVPDAPIAEEEHDDMFCKNTSSSK